ncbi:MAG: hypothetical protein H6R17_2585 [Proteobacteria bacterium]|nr:hypothetical protein [Pseudomonadota bacterium]
MTSRAIKTETRLAAGLLLLLFGVCGLFAAWIPLLTRSSIMVGEFPARVAMSCGYCAVVVILSSAVDRADGAAAVGAYRLIGRWFLWAGAFLAALSISLAVTQTRYADDLLTATKLSAVVPIGLSIFVLLAYLIGRPAKRQTTSRRARWTKPALAIILCAVASLLLYQRYSEKQERTARYAAEDEAARRLAKPWTLDLNAFHGGMSAQEVRALAATTGHSLQCAGDLPSENRLRQDDKSQCWTALGNAWGEPALITMFAFSEDGLRNHLLRFPGSSWAAIEKKLDGMGQRLPQAFGIDPETRSPIIGWRLDSGLVFSAPPATGSELAVLWTAKRDLAIDHCPYQGAASRRDPQGYSVPIKQLWPEIDCDKRR